MLRRAAERRLFFCETRGLVASNVSFYVFEDFKRGVELYAAEEDNY